MPIGGLHDLLLDPILDRHHCHHWGDEEEQNVKELSSVTLNFQVTNIVMNSGFQMSELNSVSQMSQVS